VSRARAVLAGPGALRALRAGLCGRVEVVLPHAAYVRLGEGWLMVAERRAPFGPLSLVVDTPPDLCAEAPARVEGERLLLGGAGVSIGRVREHRPPSPPLSRGDPGAVAEATAAVLAGCGRLPASLRPGVAALRYGRLADAVGSLAGLGEGLTPVGDDVLAGYAAWRAAEGRPVALTSLAAGRSSPIGHAYLRCAERGELPNAAAAVLAGIRLGSTSRVEAALPALRGWGSSSGAALAWGMAAGLLALPSPPAREPRDANAIERGRDGQRVNRKRRRVPTGDWRPFWLYAQVRRQLRRVRLRTRGALDRIDPHPAGPVGRPAK
jgi:Protein of unknown function (DUF2877)